MGSIHGEYPEGAAKGEGLAVNLCGGSFGEGLAPQSLQTLQPGPQLAEVLGLLSPTAPREGTGNHSP